MTSPNVGKITISASVDSGEIKNQLEKQLDPLTRDMKQKLLPQMEKLNKTIADINKKIGAMDSSPYEEIRKEAEKVADKHRKIAKALDSEADAQLRVEKATERQRKAQVAVNKELKKTNDIDKVSESLKQRLALANKDVEAAERKLGITRQRVADEQVAAHEDVILSSKKSMESQIRDAKRITAEIERESRKRIVAADREHKARSKKIDDIRRGVLGPVDVVGEIARGFGGLGRLSTPAFNTVVLGALAATGAVASLSKAVFLLPAAFSAAAVGVGTLMVGLQGFGETMKQLMAGDMEKFSVAVHNLSPNAQQAALGIQALLPRFKELRLAVQDALFTNAEPMITGLTDRFLPAIQQAMVGVATAMNKSLLGVTEVLMRPETMAQVQVILGNIVRAFDALGPSLGSFTQAFVDITQAGSEFLPGLAKGFADMAASFASFVRDKQQSGEIGDWIERGLQTAKIFVDIVWDLGRAFMSLAPVAEQILPHVASILHDIADILEKYPKLIYAVPAMFVGWSTIKGLFGLLDTLLLVRIALGATGAGSIGAAAAAGAAAITTAFAGIGKIAIPVTFSIVGGNAIANAIDGGNRGAFDFPDIGQEFRELMEMLNGTRDPNTGRLRPGNQPVIPPSPGTPLTPGNLIPGLLGPGGKPVIFPPSGAPLTPKNLLPSLLAPGGPPAPPITDQNPLPVVPTGPGGSPDWLPDPQNLPLPPLPVEDDKKTTRDYLSGRVRGPLTEISDANKKMLTRLQEQIKKTPMPGTEIGPFGTPIKPRNRGYEMAAAAISALGGDPEAFLGENPIKIAEQNWTDFLDRVAESAREQLEPLLQQPRYDPRTHPGIYGSNGMPAGADWQALAQFESSGRWNANTGNGFFGGLQFTRETWMANKPSGAPDNPWEATQEQQIAAAENVLKSQGPGAWPAASAQHPEWFQPQPGMAGLPGGTGGGGWFQPLADAGVGGGPRGSKAGLQPAAANLWDVIAKAFPQIAEIGGVRQDRLPYHPSGRALDIMIPGTGGLNDPTPPDAKALGDSIFQFLMTNASQLGIDTNGTLWQQADHFNHIHAQLLDGFQQFTDAGGLATAPGMVAPGGTPGMMSPGMFPGLAAGGVGGTVPVYITNWPGQAQDAQGRSMFDMARQNLLDPLTQASGQVAGNVAGDVARSALGAILPQARAGPPTDLSKLVEERNPLSLLGMAGFNVPDFTVAGGGPSAQDLMPRQGPEFDASGRMFSDTAALLDRTFSTQEASNQARHEQLLSVMNQVADRLGTDLLEPVVSSGVSAGVEGLSKTALDTLGATLGTQIGQTAGPIIAAAVRDAIPPPQSSGDSGGAANAGGGLIAGLFDEGGMWPSGTVGANLSGAAERVLSPSQTAAFNEGLLGGWNLQPMQQHFATTSGVNVNEHVGSEFLGVSQIPILNVVVDLLVRVLLQILGVQIESRDTLDEMSDGFREFRGEFKAFDAMGRLMNDTSALIERTSTSEQAAADERIRILKIVIEELIKYVIENVVIPIGKAIGNAVVQAGASAASAAINTQAPMAGSIVGSLITSAGSAGIDIIADIGGDFAVGLVSVLTDGIAEGLQSIFPDIVNSIFGGDLLASIADPISSMIFDPILGLLGAFVGIFGGSAFDTFDEGGLAHGTGMMPKATIAPERVLSAHQTASFDRLVSALERGAFGSGATTTIHAPFTVTGGERGGREARDRLLALMS